MVIEVTTQAAVVVVTDVTVRTVTVIWVVVGHTK